MFRTNSQLAGAVAGVAVLAAAAINSNPAGADAVPTLTPEPPDWYTCQTTGNGTVCKGTTEFQHVGEYDGACPGGFDILENGHSVRNAHRYYNRNGLLERRLATDIFPVGDPLNIVYNSVTGKAIPYRADLHTTDILGVPGDLASVTSTQTGNLYTITTPGQGLMVHDTGLFTFSPEGDILKDHGPKMLFSGDVEKLCAALS